MKNAKMKYLVMAVFLVVSVTITGYTFIKAQEKPQENPITGSNYLYIEEMEIGFGMVANEAIAEAQGWVKTMRETGEYKSVRLFIHNTGPRFALYILAEPNNWQSIETGAEKWLAAHPEIMSQPFKWGAHSDNLLSEIPVE